MPKYTRLLQFDHKTIRKIVERDCGCIFCMREYHMENQDPLQYGIKDIMHYIPKSKRGLGIEQNGVLGCRYHHHMLDNGGRGLREEMLGIVRQYLQEQYPDWEEDRLTYQKWRK